MPLIEYSDKNPPMRGHSQMEKRRYSADPSRKSKVEQKQRQILKQKQTTESDKKSGTPLRLPGI